MKKIIYVMMIALMASSYATISNAQTKASVKSEKVQAIQYGTKTAEVVKSEAKAAKTSAQTTAKAAKAEAKTEAVKVDENVSEFKTRSRVAADSIRAKGKRIGKRVAASSAVAADSIASVGGRVGEKVGVKADTIAQRSKRAWKALKGE